ncbi:hypothetical protein F4780DRAFT_387968 [Xylariomycetidae sp. FL0641]|nr:hypothetical protein F4780DRAFT_387968 [Xylariomycetidae sp. FL0641]
MTTFQTLPDFTSHATRGSNKISKPRTKAAAVKPILKRLASTSERSKSSLDLDRGWDEQDEEFRGLAPTSYPQDLPPSTSPERTTSHPHAQQPSAAPEPNGPASGRRFEHERSISGASLTSVATTSSSSGAPRPMQQIPRSASYANSVSSAADTRDCDYDYSPSTITEDEDIDCLPPTSQMQAPPPTSHGNSSSNNNSNSNSNSQAGSGLGLGLHRPSLASHRASSDLTTAQTRTPSIKHSPSQSRARNPPPPPLRIATRTNSSKTTKSSRLANVSSRSDIYLEEPLLESPTSSTHFVSPRVTSPATSSPMSPLRSSLDALPRLRAKSDLDTVTRADHLREARRKFELKERAKEEKYARQEIKRRERADNKRAQELQRLAAATRREQLAAEARQEAAELGEALSRAKHSRKISMATHGRPSLNLSRPSLTLSRPSLAVSRPSLSTTARPSTSCRATPAPQESEAFLTDRHDSPDSQTLPTLTNSYETAGASDIKFRPSRRRATAKKKTHGTWTSFVLWLRVKLLRMSKNH